MRLGVALVGALLISGCASQVGYLAKQGAYLIRTSGGAQSIDAMLASNDTPQQVRQLLLRVKEIKSFAVTRIGLKDNGNYTRYKAIPGDHLVDVVSACDALSFTPYQWTYPFLGKLPYKGFYVPADARAEADRLRSQGLDVIVRPVDAFSTLGFTRDPVYSFMEGYSPFQLASTIIHEQTHATLFLRGQPQFNEELASFVGEEGAFEWLRSTYGPDSAEYRGAVDETADSAAFLSRLDGLTRRLKTVYDGPLSREQKLAQKARILSDFQGQLASEAPTLFRTPAYRRVGKLSINNAYLSLYGLYTSDVPLLREYWQKRSGGDWRRFLAAARELSRKGDVEALMRRELGAQTGADGPAPRGLDSPGGKS